MDENMRRKMEVELIFLLEAESRLAKLICTCLGEDGEVAIVQGRGTDSPCWGGFGRTSWLVLGLVYVPRDGAACDGERMGIEVVAMTRETVPGADSMIGGIGHEMIDCELYLWDEIETSLEWE